MSSIIYIPVIIVIATLWLYFLATNAPNLNISADLDSNSATNETSLQFPSSLSDLKELSTLLKGYRKEHNLYVYVLYISAYVYKQALAIPGSVFLNILAGAIFGVVGGFCLVCLLTAVGASCCYLLSKYFGKKYIQSYFPHRIAAFQTTIEENRQHLFYYLLFARLFPMTPNWFINIASPILNIPLPIFFLSVLLGLMPYNFICVQTGVVLSEINSLDDVFTYSIFLKLLLVAIVALLPSFIIKKHRLRHSAKQHQSSEIKVD